MTMPIVCEDRPVRPLTQRTCLHRLHKCRATAEVCATSPSEGHCHELDILD